MSIKAGLLVICAAVFVLIGGSLYAAMQAVQTEGDIAQAEARRYQSYKLADELRQSSDDLTRMARLYVVTGDARYKTYFDRILAIRDGRAPRPLDYDNIYWDLVVAWGRSPRRDAEAVPLERLMRDARFTDDELALLQQAKQRSDALVDLEAQAMHAVQGRFLDARGQFTVVGQPDMDLARRLMHGAAYHRAKAEIMAPLQEFFTRVESRTAAEVTQLRRRGERLHLVVISGLGTAVILVLVSFALIARYPFTGAARGTRSPSAEPPRGEQRGRPVGLAIWTVWPLVTAAVVASVLVLALSWWMSGSFEDRERKEIGNALEAVHRTTARAIDDWLAGIDQEASAWAGSALVRRVVTPPPPGSSHAETLELLAPLRSVPGSAGYVIVAAGGRVLAGDDPRLTNRNLGAAFMKGLISELSRSPDHSMVVLPDGGHRESDGDVVFPREILVAAVVPQQPGADGGVLILRFDPRRDLGRMLQQGRFGETGETYAFNRSGRIIGASRPSDRGGDLTAGSGAASLRGDRPPTPMALAGRSGLDLDGYRDYRGVSVIGAWSWNERYGLGVTTEVGLDEAYAVLRDYRSHTRAATGLSLLLIVGLSGVFAWNRLAMAAAGARLEAAYEIIRDHMDRVEEELQVGRDLQLSMVPRAFPAFPERRDVSVYATLQPAREVGGDFYDFYFVDDTHLLFCVGDVSDKGVPAALFMAVTKTLIKARSAEEPSTARLVSYVNTALARDNPQCMFVTLFLGRLDVSTGELVYTRAGHEPPFVCRSDGLVERLAERHGPLAGVAPEAVYGESRRRLGPGDLLIAYTDGVTEARDADGQLFAEDRLAGLVRGDESISTQAAVERILAAVQAFERGTERADDIAVLALRLVAAEHRGTLAEVVVLRNRLSDLDRLDGALDGLGKRGDLPPATVAELRIVCDEIVGNAIAYAFPQGGEHEIEVRLELVGRRFVVTVCDGGIPFNPLGVAPPDTSRPLEERELGGLGIHLVRSLVDEATYRRHGDRNVTTLVKEMARVSRSDRPVR